MIILNEQEQLLILVIRHFDFLRKLGYYIEDVSVVSREPGVAFYNRLLKRKIYVGLNDRGEIYFRIEKIGIRFFESPKFILDVASHLNKPELKQYVDSTNMERLIKNGAEEIQGKLQKVIDGTSWK